MDTTEETASTFLEAGYRDLTAMVRAIQKEDAEAVADAAANLAWNSARIGAEPLARAARELIARMREPRALLHAPFLSVARAFAEVESEIRGALDRNVPLFI
jgi:hypothetical protein